MNEKVFLSSQAHQNLIAHLVKFEENKETIIDEYFPYFTDEREEFYQLLTDYLQKIDHIIGNVEISDELNQRFPFVAIGCKVMIRDTETNKNFKYFISGPYYENSTTGDYISYLSPIGMALLLKQVGEIVSVDTPSGQYDYEIIEIKLAE